MPDNKDLLEAILENQREERKARIVFQEKETSERLAYQKQANRKHLQLSADLSAFKNKTTKATENILSILNNSEGNSRIGVVDQLDCNSKRIDKVEEKDKLRMAQVKVVAAITSTATACIIGLAKWLI